VTEIETAALIAALARSQRADERRRADQTRPRRPTSAPVEPVTATDRPTVSIRDEGVASRVAVYTAVLDAGSRPAPVETEPDSGVDHVCFSPDPQLVPHGWTSRPLPYWGTNAAQTRLYVASHPATLLEQYDATVWIAPALLGGRSTDVVVDALQASTSATAELCCLPSEPDGVDLELERLSRSGVSGTAPFHELVDRALRDGRRDLIGTSVLLVRANRSPRATVFDRAWWSASLATGASDDACLHLAMAVTGIRTDVLGTAFQQAHRSMLDQPPVKIGRAKGAAFDPSVERERVHAAVVRHEAVLQQTPPGGPSLAVIVPVHDAPDFTVRCLESVVATVPDHADLFIVDDGSAGETAGICARFASDHDATLLRSENASGFGAAANRGLDAAAGHEHVVVLNSDTVVPRGWVERLQAHLRREPAIGAIGPLSNDARHQSVPHVTDSTIDWSHHERNEPPSSVDVDAVNRFLAAREPEPVSVRVPVLNGFCMAFTRGALDLVGGFDLDLFERGYGEEVDWCFRAVDAGVELAVALDTYVYHAKSRSYTGGSIADLKSIAATNLRARWGDARPKRALRALARNEALRSVRADIELLFTMVGDD